MRKSTIKRKTGETDISFSIILDGSGKCNCTTGIGFFDHMMNLFARHGSFDIDLSCNGDLEVDNHHSIEDIGIAMGDALKEALGDKGGIKRYGTFYCPMDEALTRVSLDLSGRGYLVYQVELSRDYCGDFETDSLKEFLYAFAINGGLNLHISNLYGENTHHIIESIFKALGRALKEACEIVDASGLVPSTKGSL